ncbi:Predicted metal-binding protein [Rhizobiales bacterium GAS191]|jgi:predicted metal-binding protein|nr:Predicted metal-binding protein [Rhizobiales bacterium GAS113]SEC00477.1 Predicted metal-binding protein [Rhizobiales bacterium GAS191]
MSDIATSIHVCVTCRLPGEAAEPMSERAGARLYEALRQVQGRRADQVEFLPVTLLPVECLSVCKRPCTIGFSAAGKWTYVYGDFAPDDSTANAILDAAALYAAAPDGLIPWKQRPDALKKGVVARIPPFPAKPLTDLPEAAE